MTRVPLGCRPFRFSEPPYIIVTMARCVRGGSQWDQLNLTVTSLCVSCRSHCYLFACYYYFMLRLFILCYLCRTIALVATVICWLYPTLNKFYLILSYLIPATAGKQSRHASWQVRDARAVMHAGVANSRFPLNSAEGGNVPGIPGACATRNFTYLVRGPWKQHFENCISADIQCFFRRRVTIKYIRRVQFIWYLVNYT